MLQSSPCVTYALWSCWMFRNVCFIALSLNPFTTLATVVLKPRFQWTRKCRTLEPSFFFRDHVATAARPLHTSVPARLTIGFITNLHSAIFAKALPAPTFWAKRFPTHAMTTYFTIVVAHAPIPHEPMPQGSPASRTNQCHKSSSHRATEP